MERSTIPCVVLSALSFCPPFVFRPRRKRPSGAAGAADLPAGAQRRVSQAAGRSDRRTVSLNNPVLAPVAFKENKW